MIKILKNSRELNLYQKSLGEEEPVFTEEFTISSLIQIALTVGGEEFNPGDSFIIEGDAIREGGREVEGFADIKIVSNSSEFNQQAAVSKGYFSSNITLAEDMKAGAYSVQVNVYEKDIGGNILNQGLSSTMITIRQIPTNLEIAFETELVEPGTGLKVKGILHDQTGEKIESTVLLTVKDRKGKILEQIEKQTDEFLELSIPYNEPAGIFTVSGISQELENEAKCNITKKKDVKIELVNKTLIITNVGNIEYCNESIVVKVGEEILTLDSCLDVDEEKKYSLSAPDGEYRVEIIKAGESTIEEGVLLTGGAIGIKEAGGLLSVVRYPFVWVFIIFILGFVAFMVVKKGYRRSFIGYVSKLRKRKKSSGGGKSGSGKENRAEVSLSIKGHKQNAVAVCLKLKNQKEIKDDLIKDTMGKLEALAKDNKAVVYENQDNLIFILAPTKTKTFANEKPALKIAEMIQGIIKEHNKLFKQKIEFGLAINSGSIIAKQEGGSLKFMSMGTFITNAKKMAGFSKEEILLSHTINQKLGAEIKASRRTHGDVHFYKLDKVKNSEQHKKFLDTFLKGLEQDKK